MIKIKSVVLFILCCICSAPVLSADSFHIGNAHITIPSPTGFHPVANRFPEVGEMMAVVTAPSMRLLEGFYSEGDLGRLLAGEDPIQERYMLIETLKSLSQKHVSKDYFRDVVSDIRNQQNTLLSQVKDTVNALLRNSGKQFSTDYDKIFETQMMDQVDLGVFHETRNVIAFVALAKVSETVNNTKTVRVSVGAVSLVHIKGKILYASVTSGFQDESDIDWVKKASREWTQAITASNSKISKSKRSTSNTDKAPGSSLSKAIGMILALLIVTSLLKLFRK